MVCLLKVDEYISRGTVRNSHSRYNPERIFPVHVILPFSLKPHLFGMESVH